MKEKAITIANGTVIVPANEEVWMTQHQIADLFECFVAKVNANVRSILKSGVLDERKVCREHTCKNGSIVELYGLEMITALSFRIKARNADLFREYIINKARSRPEPRQILLLGNNFGNVMLN